MSTILKNLAARISQYKQQRADELRQRKYINQIIENIVDDIDPRLRSISSYKKTLFPCVKHILAYAEIACSHLPGPIEFSKEARRNNATVRSLFANHKKMTEVFSRCKELQDFFKAHPSADCAYMILGMRKTENQVFGIKQQGEIIRKDVPQTTVTFNDYRISNPSTSEASLRVNLHERALHECVAQTMSRLLSEQSHCENLEEQKIKLKMQLRMLQHQEDGLEPLMHDDSSLLQRISEVKESLANIQISQDETTCNIGTLNSTLDKTASLLDNPEELVNVSTISLCIDRLNHLVDDDSGNDEDRVNLAQVTFSDNEKRVGLLVVFPKKEFIVPERSKLIYSK